MILKSEAYRVPAFMGCVWMNGVPGTMPKAPPFDGNYWGGNSGGLGRYWLNRHSGYVGSSFLGGSARKVGMKEMLRLKWNRKYDTNKWYEEQEADGWPTWMANFKDY